MYEEFFGLSRPPFASLAEPELYVPSESIDTARITAFRAICRGEGAALVVGPSGTGKTMLVRVLAAELQSRLRVASLQCGRFDGRAGLLKSILHALSLPHRGMDESELRLSLMDFAVSEDCPGGVAIVIDEAQMLTLSILEEIRGLINTPGRSGPGFRVVFCGGMVLEENFTHPKLASLSQSIVARGYLEPLRRPETETYVHTRLGMCGVNGPSIFPPQTCKTIHQATGGVQRLVNQVCDLAMLRAMSEDRRTLGATDIQVAWAELQQLPTPWSDEIESSDAPAGRESTAAAESVVIEFGQLDEEPLDGSTDFPRTNVAATSAGPVQEKLPGFTTLEDTPSFEEYLLPGPEASMDFDDSDDDDQPIDLFSGMRGMDAINVDQTPCEGAFGDVLTEAYSPPMKQLDQIARLIDDVAQDMDAEDNDTADVVLEFEDFANPFDEAFDEEYQVADDRGMMPIIAGRTFPEPETHPEQPAVTAADETADAAAKSNDESPRVTGLNEDSATTLDEPATEELPTNQWQTACDESDGPSDPITISIASTAGPVQRSDPMAIMGSIVVAGSVTPLVDKQEVQEFSSATRPDPRRALRELFPPVR